MTFGDLVSGLLSQYLKSRKKAVTAFISFSLFFVLIYLLFMRGASNTTMHFIISMMGFGNGFWTVFVTISAENFGTNLRATVATTVPNFSRGSLVPITGIFTTLTPAHFSPTTSALILTVLIYGLCYLSLWKIEETFGKDLDFLEIQTSSASKKKITKTE
jgi:sugar phosphate permease